MALSTLYRVLDDKITERLNPYLAIGYGKDDKPYSDVIVKDGNVEIINLFARPQMLTDELAAMGLPFRVRMLHSKHVKVIIPWFSWSTNPVEVEIDGPLSNPSNWSLLLGLPV